MQLALPDGILSAAAMLSARSTLDKSDKLAPCSLTGAGYLPTSAFLPMVDTVGVSMYNQIIHANCVAIFDLHKSLFYMLNRPWP